MKHARVLYITYLAQLFFCTFYITAEKVSAEISFGELIDKITILTIKSQRITDEEKLKNVRTELASLQNTCDHFIGNRANIANLQALLQEINEALWDIEDAIRIKERHKEFDDEFIALARGVYTTNDKRCAVKKQIDIILGSHITEEKSYEKHE